MPSDSQSSGADAPEPSGRVIRYQYDPQLLADLETGNIDFEALRQSIFTAYFQETGRDPTDLDEVVKWLNLDNKMLGTRIVRSPATKFGVFTSIEDKMGLLGQRHCLICSRYGPYPMHVFSVRIPPISNQSSDRLIRAFRLAVEDNLTTHPVSQELYDARLCVAITFVIGDKIFGRRRGKNDLDNMAKPFIDGMKTRVFRDDEQIDHLDLMRLHSRTDETFIKIRLHRTNVDGIADVIRPTTKLGWAGKEFINLEDYM